MGKMGSVPVFLLLAAGAGLVGAGYVLGQQKSAPEVRRVVTKLDESGKAVVMFDNYAADDRGKTKVGLVPPKSGTVFRIVDFAPDSAPGHPSDMNYTMRAPAPGGEWT
jgi:hypothetical protein